MKVKEIAISRRARKGAAHRITADGAYWLALDIKINARGDDGIGQGGADLTDYYRVRHYRDGSVRAYCETESWHQNYGSGTTRVRCDQTLNCETIEDLEAAIERVPYDSEYAEGHYRVGNYQDTALAEAMPELPVALPAPDDDATIAAG